ncbi:SDR family NAD(P)-dependent oxidoreductase [Pseudonocardia charpentierae]|uniref:SDR family NAD(P)-dependent oxidoreductase n=1 Tax=Pseudonocardia charpentierae TaxID=3075545 RepID=A0ABU2NJV7_9PSEU|nr:SDR family NAD(P)-dependent oxidoreductase [Pseudonocardia sp. DSM 45834]MDT0353713.1 SDR family NAD(P)-dependent oxidoreductase [Pseudonocardia sp. DSM 45834]
MTGDAGDGRVVVVTGANRGLGLEVVRQCAARGDTVVLGSRDVDAGRRAAVGLGDGVRPVALDVTDVDGLAAAADEVDRAFGRVDVLVNNAAIHYDTWQNAVDVDLGVVREAWETNVLGAWQTTLAFLPLLRRSAHPRVVMVSSESGSLTSMGAGVPAYAVSKAALNALTRTLAGDLRRDGVLVNAVCPGWTATDMGGNGGRPVGEGAASILWAVDLPDDGPTGTFTRDGRPVPW